MTRLCSIEGCNRPHAARGWCLLHWRHNTGRAIPRDQFLAKVKIEHGTENAARRCHCDKCRAAAAEARRRRRHNNIEATREYDRLYKRKIRDPERGARARCPAGMERRAEDRGGAS